MSGSSFDVGGGHHSVVVPSVLTEKYDRIEEIGHGSYGRIFRARRKSDGLVVAIKQVNFMNKTGAEQNDAFNEAMWSVQLEHKYIVKFYERFLDGGSFYLVMEYLSGGDLQKLIYNQLSRNRYLEEDHIWRLCIEMTLGIKYLHDLTIMHRDLKPQNVLLDSHGHVKICDFGFGKLLGAQQVAYSCVGTPLYSSPELVRKEEYDYKSDIWALGCIIYQLAALRPPFDSRDDVTLRRQILDSTPPPLPKIYSKDLSALVMSMLDKVSERRPDAVHILSFPPVHERLLTLGLSYDQGNLEQEKEAIWKEIKQSIADGESHASQLPSMVEKLASAHIELTQLRVQLQDARKKIASSVSDEHLKREHDRVIEMQKELLAAQAELRRQAAELEKSRESVRKAEEALKQREKEVELLHSQLIHDQQILLQERAELEAARSKMFTNEPRLESRKPHSPLNVQRSPPVVVNTCANVGLSRDPSDDENLMAPRKLFTKSAPNESSAASQQLAPVSKTSSDLSSGESSSDIDPMEPECSSEEPTVTNLFAKLSLCQASQSDRQDQNVERVPPPTQKRRIGSCDDEEMIGGDENCAGPRNKTFKTPGKKERVDSINAPMLPESPMRDDPPEKTRADLQTPAFNPRAAAFSTASKTKVISYTTGRKQNRVGTAALKGSSIVPRALFSASKNPAQRPHRFRFIHFPAAHFKLELLLSRESTVNAIFAWTKQQDRFSSEGFNNSCVISSAQWVNSENHELLTPTQHILLLVRAHPVTVTGSRLRIRRLFFGYAQESTLSQIDVESALFSPVPVSSQPMDGSQWGYLELIGRSSIKKIIISFENPQLVEEVAIVRATKLLGILSGTEQDARTSKLPNPESSADSQQPSEIIDSEASLKQFKATFNKENTRLEQQLTVAKEHCARSRLQPSSRPPPPDSPMHF